MCLKEKTRPGIALSLDTDLYSHRVKGYRGSPIQWYVMQTNTLLTAWITGYRSHVWPCFCLFILYKFRVGLRGLQNLCSQHPKMYLFCLLEWILWKKQESCCSSWKLHVPQQSTLQAVYAVKVQRSLAPLSQFRGSHITTAHEQECCRFQSYAKSVPSPMKFTSKIYKAWTTFLGSTSTDHVVTFDFNSVLNLPSHTSLIEP